MFEGKSETYILRTWLRAAEEFTESLTPHVGTFAAITGHAAWYTQNRDDLADMTRMIEEIAGARAATNPDKVDGILLRSKSPTSRLSRITDDLLQLCVNSGILIGAEERSARQDAIRAALQRRRRAMGLKGRSYRPD